MKEFPVSAWIGEDFDCPHCGAQLSPNDTCSEALQEEGVTATDKCKFCGNDYEWFYEDYTERNFYFFTVKNNKKGKYYEKNVVLYKTN